MSIILDVKSDLSNLSAILERYDNILNEAEDNLIISGKTLHDANKEQPMHMAYYASKLVELKSIKRKVEIQVDQQRGLSWKRCKENSSIALGTRDIDQYVNSEDNMVSLHTMVAIVNELAGQFEVLVEAFRSRGFALRNITEARIAEVQEFAL